MNKQLKADLLLVLCTAFWGASYYLTDLCMTEMPPLFLNAFRFTAAFLVLGAVFFQRLRRVNRVTLRYALLIGLALAGCYIFYGYGVSRTSLSNAGFICALPVVFTPVTGWLLYRVKPSRRLIPALLLCTAGLALLTLNESLRPRIGDLLCVGVAVCYSLDLVLTERAVQRSDVDPVALGVCNLGVVAVITLALSLVLETPSLPQSGAVWGGALFLGLFCSGAAFIIQTVQQQHTDASHVGLIFTLEPVFAALVAFFIAGEVLPLRGYLGAAIMLISLLWMELGSHKAQDKIEV